MATSTIKSLGQYVKGEAFTPHGSTGEADLNWISKSGVYVYNTSTSGHPANSFYGMVVHFCTVGGATGWHWQLAFDVNNDVYVRANINPTSSNYSTNWGSWKSL